MYLANASGAFQGVKVKWGRAGPLRRGQDPRDLSPRVQRRGCEEGEGTLSSTSRHRGPARHQSLSTLTPDFRPAEKKPLLLLYRVQRVLCYGSPSRHPRTFYREVQLRQTALLP